MQEWKSTNGNRAMAVSDFDRIVISPVIRLPPGNRSNMDDGETEMGTTGAVSTNADFTQGSSRQSHAYGGSENTPHIQHGMSCQASGLLCTIRRFCRRP
jgi:hypothetical protein